MRYRVRNPDGEVGFARLEELRRALEQGLVGPMDELSVDGAPFSTVAQHSALQGYKPERTALQKRSRRWYAWSAGLSVALLYLIITGRYLGAFLVLVLSMVFYGRWIREAFGKPRPRGRSR